MKRVLLFATNYPYTTGIIAIIWLGSIALLKIDPSLSPTTVIIVNVCLTSVIAIVGFRR